MRRGVTTITLVICILFLVVFLNLSIQLDPGPHTTISNDKSSSETFIPEGWTGIPISKNNPLYSDVNNPTHKNGMKRLVDRLLTLTREQWIENDELWSNIFDEYENIVGWNGIFDAIVEVETELKYDNAQRRHAFGEELYKRTPNIKFGVEIASRNILYKAPLHGLIWKEIEATGVSDTVKFLEMSDEICFFKHTKDMGNIWISCKYTMLLIKILILINYNCLGVHGIGHGLAMIFGKEEIETALNICQAHSDSQFQYSCASGIYMVLLKEYHPLSDSPCDLLHFPATCFRFKNRLYTAQDHCLSQIDEYHSVGCIWGQGYVDHNCTAFLPVKGSQHYERDEIRHAACVDGTLSTIDYEAISAKGKSAEEFCSGVKDYPLSYEICEKRAKNSFQTFTFTKDSDYFYNTQILENQFL